MGEGNERANGRGLGDELMKGAGGTIRRNLRMFDWAMAGRMRKDKNKWVNSAIIFGTGSFLQLFSKTGSFLQFLPFFKEFSETKSSLFLKGVISNQMVIEVRLFKKTWRTLNCTPKTLKVIREIQENLLCIGKRKELITKNPAQTTCFCSRTWVQLNAKRIISSCKNVASEINSRHDTVVNILPNIILKQRGLISHEQRWDEMKTNRTANAEITVGTEHPRSDE